MRTVVVLTAALALTQAITGVATDDDDDDRDIAAAPVAKPTFATFTPGEVIEEPLIRPGHVLSVVVNVAGRKEIEELEKRVSAAGYMTLPLTGNVYVNGLTPAVLSDRLQVEFSEYLRAPVVEVAFAVDKSRGAVSPWGYVTVQGAVQTPGRINIPPTQDLTLSMAVQLAGGLSESAKDTAIKVTRKLADGETISKTIDLRSAASHGELQNDILLRASDTIFVPEKVF